MSTPRPWNWIWVSAPASGGGHLYLIDPDQRKIAALWGGADEKADNAALIVRAVNAHDDLLLAAKEAAVVLAEAAKAAGADPMKGTVLPRLMAAIRKAESK
jgi:hypothetical protein